MIVIPAKRSPCEARAGTPLFFDAFLKLEGKRGSKSPAIERAFGMTVYKYSTIRCGR